MQTKRLLSLKCIFYVGLVFLGPYSFAQNEEQTNEVSESSSEINEEHDTKNLNKLLIDYNKEQQKVLNDAQKMLPDENDDESALQELTDQSTKRRKKIKRDQDNTNLNLKKVKYSEAVKIALEPLQQLSESELSKLIRDKVASSSAKKIFGKYPSLIDFTVRLIKDKLAIPSLAKIIDDEKRLIKFSITMLSTFLISFLLKYLLKRPGRTILMAISLWFLRFLIMYSIRIGIVVYFFSHELAPTFKIAMDLAFRD